MAVLSLTTTLHPRGPAAAVVLTDEQVLSLGATTKTPPMRVTVNGHTFPGRVGRRDGENLVGLSRAVRLAAGLEPGDVVEVRIELDTDERTIEVPEDLAAALADAGSADAFAGLAPSHRQVRPPGVSGDSVC